MITATAEYLFKSKNKSYIYHLELPDQPTAHDISLAIARAVMKELNRARTRMGKFAPMYALTMKLFDIEQVKLNGEFLAQTARIQIPKGNPDPRKDAYLLANQRNEETKPVILTCDKCDGSGFQDNGDDCSRCDGEGFIIWRLTNRVGRTYNDRLIIDVDGHDELNLNNILIYICNLYYNQTDFIKFSAYWVALYQLNTNEKIKTLFKVGKTGNGYWIRKKELYDNVDDWLYDNCRLLKPDLERKDLKSYIKKLIALDESTKKLIGGKGALTKKIKESDLYKGFGDFDVIYTLISIKVKKHTVRDSQKFPNDIIELLE